MSRTRSVFKSSLVVAMLILGSVVAAHAAAARSQKPPVSLPDPAVTADVRKTLSTDPVLAESTILVKSVRGGVVFLSGVAASTSDEARALETVSSRPGVRGVISQMATLDEVTSPNVATRVRAPIATVFPVQLAPVETDDDVIRRNVRNALYDLDSRNNAGIEVVVRDGVVWLSGTVPAWEGNDARLAATRSVTGVRSIVNSMRVAGPRDQRR